MDDDLQILDTLTVWGTVDEIKPLIEGLSGIRITNAGFDKIDPGEAVVELTYDTGKISDLEIFGALQPLLKDFAAAEANRVGISTWKKWKEQ